MLVTIGHTLFRQPAPSTEDAHVLDINDGLRSLLRRRVATPMRWVGSLHRLSLARAVQGSNSIEGYDASLEDVVAAVDGEEALDVDAETRGALTGYRDAMTFVLQLSRDRATPIDGSLLRSLHFMMLKHDLRKNPGRWRPGAVYVRREPDGSVVYEGPDPDLVPDLVRELVGDLEDEDGHVLIRGAMAHLNLVMIHPFSDGNGRMARCVQTLVLARDGILAPQFSSIEEYLGRNTEDYYRVLAAVGGGSWQPGNDPRPWVRFCLTAHFRQCRTLLRRVRESEELWELCSTAAARAGLPARTVGPLFDAALGLRLRNSTYRSNVLSAEGEELTEQTASRDLRALVGAGLLVAIGEKRGRLYVGDSHFVALRSGIRDRRRDPGEDDPYAIVRSREHPTLPF